jgi:hypothetical protein
MNQRTVDWGLADQIEFELLDALERLRQSKPDPRDFFSATEVFDDVYDKYKDKVDRSLPIGVMNRLLSDGLTRGVEHAGVVGLQISKRGRERLVELRARQKEYSKKGGTHAYLVSGGKPPRYRPLASGGGGGNHR